MPISLVTFLHEALTDFHQSLEEAVQDLTPEQFHARPHDQGNHIAFTLWHYVRTEDNVVRFVIQRRPTVWMDGGWHEKFGLDPKVQGTGMAPEEAQALRLPPPGEFLPYMRQVWGSTGEFLHTLDEETLQRLVKVWPLGEMPIRRVLGNTCLTHGHAHLGEIWHIRTMMGLGGSPI